MVLSIKRCQRRLRYVLHNRELIGSLDRAKFPHLIESNICCFAFIWFDILFYMFVFHTFQTSLISTSFSRLRAAIISLIVPSLHDMRVFSFFSSFIISQFLNHFKLRLFSRQILLSPSLFAIYLHLFLLSYILSSNYVQPYKTVFSCLICLINYNKLVKIIFHFHPLLLNYI